MPLSKFFHQKGNKNVPAALKILNQKFVPKLLYGVPVWIEAFNNNLESLHSAFLRSLVEVPRSVSNLTLVAELGQQKLET